MGGDGLWFVGLPLLSGRLEGDRKRGLRALVERYQPEVRLTANQDLLLCNIGKDQREEISHLLTDLGWEDPTQPSRPVVWRSLNPSASCRRCSAVLRRCWNKRA